MEGQCFKKFSHQNADYRCTNGADVKAFRFKMHHSLCILVTTLEINLMVRLRVSIYKTNEY